MCEQHYYSACWIVRPGLPKLPQVWEVLLDCGEGQMECVSTHANRQDAENEAAWRTMVYDSIAHSITFEMETEIECTSQAMLEVVTEMLRDECDGEPAVNSFTGGDISGKEWTVRVTYKETK